MASRAASMRRSFRGWLARHGEHRLRLAATLAFALLLVWASWPAQESGLRFPDSYEYLRWPDAVKPEGVSRLGPRMPSYPLLLRVVGVDAALVHLQSWLSLASFALLGGVVAGLPGLLLGGLLSLAPEIHVFCGAVLSESLCFSLLALLTASGLLLARRWRAGIFAAWSLALIAFGFARPGHLLLLPFLLVPFVVWLPAPRSAWPWRIASGPGARRLAAAALLAGGVALAALWLAERAEFWRMNYLTAMMERVVTDEAARDWFRQRGMPTPVHWSSAEFASWYDTRGRATYQGWVLARPASYREAWGWLLPEGQRETILERYADPAAAPASRLGLAALGGWLYRGLALPRPLWLAILLLPWLDWRATRRVGPLALLAAALVPAAYLQCFVGYHASGAEEVRHTLASALLYRFSCAFALAWLLERWLSRRRPSAAPALGSTSR